MHPLRSFVALSVLSLAGAGCLNRATFPTTSGGTSAGDHNVGVDQNPSGDGNNLGGNGNNVAGNGNGTAGNGNNSSGNGNSPTTPTFTVQPLFSNAPNWTDYVVNDGNFMTASNTACAPGAPGLMSLQCLHGGALRLVDVPTETSCAPLTFSDALGLFNWICDTSTGHVRIISTGLQGSYGLATLLDFQGGAWRPNSVAIVKSGTPLGSTATTAWWSNPVSIVSTSQVLSSAGVYLVNNANNVNVTAAHDHTALVINPNVTLVGTTPASQTVLVSNANFTWFEGSIDGNNLAHGLVLQNAHYAMVQHTSVSRATSHGLWLNGGGSNTVDQFALANTGGNALVVSGNSAYNTLSNFSIQNSGAAGLFLTQTTNNYVANGRAAISSNEGMLLAANANNNLVTGIAIYASSDAGLRVSQNANNVVTNVLSTGSNGASIFVDQVTDSVFIDIVGANSGTYEGLAVNVLKNSVFLTAALTNNKTYGINLTSASQNTLANLISGYNRTFGVTFTAAVGNRFHGVYSHSAATAPPSATSLHPQVAD